MGTSVGGKPPRSHAKHWRRRAALCCLTGLLSACVAVPPTWRPNDGLLIPRDTIAIAYETGRRDAVLLHPPRSTSMLTALALPIGLFASRATGEYWAAPAAIVGVSLSGTVWSYRESQRPAPVAPDSMRARYGLDDAFSWSGYQRGFQGEIESRRRAELARSSQMTVFMALAWGLTFFAFRSRR